MLVISLGWSAACCEGRMATVPLKSSKIPVKVAKSPRSKSPAVLMLEGPGKDESDQIAEVAEQCHNEVLKHLASSDGDMQVAGSAFDRMGGFVAQLARENDRLKAAMKKDKDDEAQLDNEFEEIRNRLGDVINNLLPNVLPPDHKPGDPIADAAAISGAVTNLIQNLAEAETEDKQAKKMVRDLEKQLGKEQQRLEGLQRATPDALSTYKELFGDATGNLADMLHQLQQMLEEERNGKARAQKQLELCRKMIEALQKELQDVDKVLRQLYAKCGQIDATINELRVKPSTPPPIYRPETGPADLLNNALAWLMDVMDKLIQAMRTVKQQLKEISGQQDRMEDDAKKKADQLKRAVKEMADLDKRLNEAYGQVKQEKNANDGAQENMDDQRALHDRHLDQLKQFCKDEGSCIDQVGDLLKALMKELKETLKKVKEEEAAHPGDEPGLVKSVDEMLKELENMQREHGEDGQPQRDRAEQLKADKEKLKKQLKDAKDRLKAANDKKKALAAELDGVKAQLDKLLNSEHEMEDKLPGYNDQHDKMQREIAALEIENGRLDEKAKGADRQQEMRTQLLKQLEDREKELGDEMEKLQNENVRLKRERPDSKEEPHSCPNCQDSGDPQKEVDALRKTLRKKKKGKDSLAPQLGDEVRNMDRMKPGSIERPKAKTQPMTAEAEPRETG